MKWILAVAFLTIFPCLLIAKSFEAPKWLLIEYPDRNKPPIMRFPGVRAETFAECERQAKIALEMRGETSFSRYKGKFMCGSHCRFDPSWGTPRCDELIEIR